MKEKVADAPSADRSEMKTEMKTRVPIGRRHRHTHNAQWLAVSALNLPSTADIDWCRL